MNTAHVGVGGAGAVLGIVIAYALRRWVGIDLTTNEGTAVGAAVGVGLGHLFSGPGLVPAVRRALFGPSTPADPVAKPTGEA